MFMLRSTHALLLELKGMQQQIHEDRAARAENALRRAEAVILELKREKVQLRKLLVDQHKTISELTRDLVVVRGATRTRTEPAEPKDTDPELHPDVILSDETRQGLQADVDAVRDAQKNLDKMLAELSSEYDAQSVSPEAVAAATPDSEDDWREEHAPIAD